MDAAYKLNSLAIKWSDLLPIAVRAGEIILEQVRSCAALTIMHKPDSSPVTQADQQASEYIVAQLQQLYPDIPCLSEESTKYYSDFANATAYWCVDPLDGTRGFIAGDKIYTVNIALMVHGRPVVGVVYAPAVDELYYGSMATGAFKVVDGKLPQPIKARAIDWQRPAILTGKFNNKKRMDMWLEHYPQFRHVAINSSYKFCLLAAGEADVYPRFGAISIWDIAAGSALLFAAGGTVVDFSNKQMQYTVHKDFGVVPFIALAASRNEQDLLSFIQKLGER